MAYTSLLTFGVCFVVLFHGCFGQLEQMQQRQQWQFQQQRDQHRLRARTHCRIERLTAQEPNRRIESEAGVTEFWDRNNNEQMECAGVEVVRKALQPRGLVLPSYTHAPKLIYIVRGRGIHGTVLPGCAETYESESQSQSESMGERRQRFRDRHQKIRRIQEGDILALPAGVAHWAYNDGEEPLVCVTLIDTSNDANQLDENFRKFYLAGNMQRGQGGRGQQERERQRERPGQQERERRGQYGQEGPRGPRYGGPEQEAGNVFNGFDEQILADSFNVDPEIVRRLQGQDDERGSIVRAERLQVLKPQWEEEEEQYHGRGRRNGLEETLCTMRLRENLGNPRRADVYNPRGGRISTTNSQKLPILNQLRLSAERGVLYKNAILAPHWNMNAHSIIYITRGSGRLQIVGNSGRSAFDDEVREGQLIVVPQNFAVVKKAREEGLEWVAFKTNDNAMVSPLAGRLSAVRAMPEEVLMNSYDISREEARNLKYNRQEARVLSPGARSQGEYSIV